MIIFLSFLFPGVSESPGKFLKLMKKSIPKATELIPTPPWCQRAECYNIFFFSSHWLLHILSLLCFDPNEAPSLAVCGSSCADPGMFFMGCVCYRRPFLHFSGKGLKALSAAGIPGYHFDVKLLSWEIRQPKREKVLHMLPTLTCFYIVK